ncbi:neurotrophin 1 [Calliphora vicina]|uniref:neurotrophin 1 n=1 Tax=Calliphora vicina TaxID=7373 RepID=UPI00325B63DC
MRMGQSLRCLFWATLYCVLYLVSASDEDLLDFDFTDLKEIDWNYENDNSKELLPKGTTEENLITFDDDNDLLEENQVHPFDWREKVLRTALSKALSNKAVRQKFVEVMPILRVLSKQQRLALSALITSQINAKKGNELKLDQVRMMFGDDKSLILPIVFDIANLVRNSAKKYIEFDYNLADFGDFSKTKISYERRNLELSPEELAAEENNEGIGTLPATAQMTQGVQLDGLEDFMSEEILDPKEINEELEELKELSSKNDTNTNLDNVSFNMESEEVDDDDDVTDPLDINRQLQKDVPTFTLLKLNKTQDMEISTTEKPTEKTSTASTITKTTPKIPLRRIRRSLRKPKEFVHKLVRSVPLTLSEEDLQRGNAGRTLKLNTTAFASPKETTIRANTPSSSTYPSTSTTITTRAPIIVTPESVQQEEEHFEPYQLVEDMAFASLNGSEIFLDADDNKNNDLITEAKSEPDDEVLPTPEELIAGPRYRLSGNKLMTMRSKVVPANRKRIQVRAKPKKGSAGNGVPAPKKCERFTASMCIKTDDYPIDQIMGSIRRHRNAMTALLAEYSDKASNAVDTSEDFDDYIYGQKRRQDNDIQGGLCQSIVRYARPQKARSASGEWKYIVNTGQHTQTLRLEKCMNPQESCSYLAASYRSHCAQVYNYHRLLSWDKTRGLHVDIFKVPTCCSCQIDGYKQQFPALSSQPQQEDFTPIYKGEMYQQYQQHQQQQLDYNDEEEEEDEESVYGTQFQQHKHDASFDANELSSNRVKSKVPSPTVGSYLSPPGSGKYEQTYLYKFPRDTATTKTQQSPSLSSSASNKHYSREVQRRRPHKSYGGDSRADLDFSPSEQHAEREVNDFGTAKGKDESTHQKRKTIYSVTHTASTGSSGISDSSTTAIPASTGTIRAVTTTATTRHRRPTHVDTNAHQKPSITATANIPTTTTAAATTTLPSSPIGSASLPTHYYTRSRHVLKNQSRLRIPYTITSANAGAGGGGGQKNIAAPTTEFGQDVTTTTTAATSSSSSSTQPPDVYAVNPEIFKNHYKTKFNLNYTTTPTLTTSATSTSSTHPSPPKRINYSYHPIIDFFEYNRLVTNSAKTTTPPQTSRTATENTTKYLSSTHLYPHKIPNKSVAAQTPVHPPQHDQQHKQQHKYRIHQTQRRIGYGAAAAAVAAATDGVGTSSSSSGGVVFNTSPQNTNPQLNSGNSPVETDVWHPVILQDF